MKKKEKKLLENLDSGFSSIRLASNKKNLCEPVSDINFEEISHIQKEIFNGHTKKQLVIFGLNWKLLTARDIFAILKPFEINCGKIVSVSILSCIRIFVKQNNYDGSNLPWFHDTKCLDKKVQNKNDENLKILAHIICDSEKTALQLYKSCNGLEVGNGIETLDMRIINLDLFGKIFTLDSANQIPSGYFPSYLKIPSGSTKPIKKKKESNNRTISEKGPFFDIKKNKKEKICNKKYKLKIFSLEKFYFFINSNNSIIRKQKEIDLPKKILIGKYIHKKKL
jgi:hypothetical protein